MAKKRKSSRSRACKESRRLVRGGQARRRKSPWSLLLKDDASKRGRVTGVIPSACNGRREWPRSARRPASRVVPQSVFKRFVSEFRGKAFFVLREGGLPVECPACGKPMEEGYLSSKGPVFWSEEVSGFSLPTRPGDVLLGKAMGLLRPKAYLCRDCRTVTVKY